MSTAPISVVVPALNEAEFISCCLDSLRNQALNVQIFVSDNASNDATSDAARAVAGDLSISVRRLDERCGPTAHFVSAARWALESSDAKYFSFLAADDEWLSGFSSAIITKFSEVEVDIVLPSFEWRDGVRDRVIHPPSFLQRQARIRQLSALILPDWRELANLVYAVYTRAAFCSLIDALARGEDRFAADYAAAWYVLGRYQAAGCRAAVGVRHVRLGADLLSRVGVQRVEGAHMYSKAAAYARLFFRVNQGISRALAQVDETRHLPQAVVLGLRLPQALLGIPRQLNPARPA